MKDPRIKAWLQLSIPIVVLLALFGVLAFFLKDILLRGVFLGLLVSTASYLIITVLESIYGIEVLKFSIVKEKVQFAEDIIQQGLASSFSRRTQIRWRQHDEGAKTRFWVCGKTLRTLGENKAVLRNLMKKKIDIRILFPSYLDGDCSQFQLKEDTQALPTDQISTLKRCREVIDDIIKGYDGVEIREYRGIMYSNITIFDDTAFIAFYNSTGAGDRSWALQFEGPKSAGYRYVLREFERMWNHHRLVREGPQNKDVQRPDAQVEADVSGSAPDERSQ